MSVGDIPRYSPKAPPSLKVLASSDRIVGGEIIAREGAGEAAEDEDDAKAGDG